MPIIYGNQAITLKRDFNPPFSVEAFKPHLRLRDNEFSILPKISKVGKEIETLFVERIAQLLKPGGIAAVILPISILNEEKKSFIAARESLLTNFHLRAVVQLGDKTFGATGTKTVILFLQKFDEPPKRIELVTDSKDAIMENRALTDWADKDIFEGFLAKIGVSEPDYRAFLSRTRDFDAWDDVPYFAAYASAFIATNEYATKIKQRSFLAASEDRRRAWCNEKFYSFVLALEAEKLTYFGLCHRQTTLIITAPRDIKEQKGFLGYIWSDSKKQEGIHIKMEGGLMYRPDDRTAEDTLAALVRASYDEEEVYVSALSEYYHYLPLTDMLDFSSVTFNKIMRIGNASYTPVHYTGKHKLQKLGEVAPFVTEKASISDIPLESYITTDNMIKERQGVTVYEGEPQISSVTKYRKDDILISNIRPYLKKIWLADREGGCSNDVLVFRSRDTNQLLPQYLYIVLEQDAFFDYMMATAKGMKMPRGDKASVQTYEFPVPPVKVQEKIVNEFHALDKQITEQEASIRKCDEDIQAKFVEMFGDLTDLESLANLADDIIQGTSPKSEYYNETGDGLPFYQGKKDFGERILKPPTVWSTDTIKSAIKDGILMSVRAPVGDVNINPYEEICIGRGLAAIRFSDELMRCYVFNYLYFHKEEISGHHGLAFASISGNELRAIQIPKPSKEALKQFADLATQQEETKHNARKRKESLLSQREQAIVKYFR